MAARLLVSFAALLCALWLPALARAADGPSWTVQPASVGGGRPYIYLEGVPGTVLEDRLSVTNPGSKPLTVRLRPADAYNTETGALAVRGARQSKGAGTWITLAANQVTVPARTRAEVPFSVTVPPGALPGDHPGAVVAASGGREAGVRIHLRVSGPTLAALTVEDVSLAGGAIRYTLVNRGNTALTPQVTITADGLLGELLRRPPRTLPLELLPAQRVTLTEKWPGRPSLDSADIRVDATAPGAAASRATASVTFVPWGTVAGVAGALAATGGALVMLRRRHVRTLAAVTEQTDGERHLARSGS
ncbi:hypothetical protein [Streptomyces sp. NPDC020681]|uniref:hypothetical protein n=1 Tax=Streptomyces sp. NPDC020681 TaxID=3365083 RepID=UPI003791EA58